MNELNKNQKAFCRAYMKNGKNGLQAYMKVYKCKEETAKVNASKLLTNTNIQKYISELENEIKEKDLITIEEIIKELKAIAFFNIKNLYNDVGELKEVYELDDEVAKAINSIKVQQRAGAMKLTLNATDEAPVEHLDEWIKEIKTNDKLKALELLGKYIGMFNDKQNITINNNIDNPYKDLTIEELKKLAG